MKKGALISVSNKEGLLELAVALVNAGYTLLSTSGTLKYLQDHGLKVLSIAEYTGSKEILDGRVKTLHPKIHAGLLARRDRQEHLAELEANDIIPIDVAVINLYPFSEMLRDHQEELSLAEMVEYIDIGGPTMIRGAAKNFQGVTPIIDPKDYSEIINHLKESPEVGYGLRLKLAAKVFRVLSDYNQQISNYLFEQYRSFASENDSENDEVLSSEIEFKLGNSEQLRYGENPHQGGVFLPYKNNSSRRSWVQLAGKSLSYNNYLDLDASLRVIRTFNDTIPAVALIKHCNPCGFAVKDTLVSALKAAQACDPRSHFGGIVALNGIVTLELAHNLKECFYEIIVAPDYDQAAFDLLATKKALRLIKYDLHTTPEVDEYRSVEGGILRQDIDAAPIKLSIDLLASSRVPTPNQLAQLEIAWGCVRHVRSNAIVIVKDSCLIGVGAGQMSRVDAAELAVRRALNHGHNLEDSVAASDAFFPFPDGLEVLINAGVKAVVSPSGAKKDEEIVQVANKHQISLLFALTRHFRH